MKAKEFIPQSKPRNFVAKNSKVGMGGAGAHKDKKKAEKQGDLKHKKNYADETIDFDQIRRDAATKLKTDLDQQSNDRIASKRKGPDTPKEKGFWAKVGDKQIGMVKGAIKGAVKGLKGEKFEGQQPVNFEVRRKGKTPAELGGSDAWYHRGQIPHFYGFEKGTPEYVEYMKAFAEWDEGPSGGKQWESSNIQERDRSDDWDEGNTEPPNNFAVYINGKKWKVFRGRGYYADDERERAHYHQLQDWARKKSAASGKKWTVHITGEAPTE